MKVIIHAGMHKTGSSSIQKYFFARDIEGIVYPKWSIANHCGIFVQLFQDESKLGEYHGFKARGPEFIRQLPARRREWFQKLANDIAVAENKTLLLSAEDISAPSMAPAAARLHKYLRSFTDEITVIAYARSPMSFAISAFQERLKGATVKELNPGTLWPNYQRRFGMLEDIFGAENAEFRLYDRKSLLGGNVVSDFASILGLEVDAGSLPEANTSLSAEATALLYLQRRMGRGFVAGFEGAQAGNVLFIEALRRIGTRRLTFSDALWGPVMEANAQDLAWMEERLGVKMEQPRNDDAVSISNEQDLIDLALDSYGDLEKLLTDEIQTSRRPPVEKATRALELLRTLKY